MRIRILIGGFVVEARRVKLKFDCGTRSGEMPSLENIPPSQVIHMFYGRPPHIRYKLWIILFTGTRNLSILQMAQNRKR